MARVGGGTRRTDGRMVAAISILRLLVSIGAVSAAMYVVARCGTRSPMRYDLLSILGAVGLTGWFLAVEPRRWLRMADRRGQWLAARLARRRSARAHVGRAGDGPAAGSEGPAPPSP